MRAEVHLVATLNESYVRQQAHRRSLTLEQVEAELVDRLTELARGAIQWHDGVRFVVTADVVGDAGPGH